MKTIFAVALLSAGMLVSNLAAAEGDAVAGEAVYNRACKMCHASGMMGAPKLGDAVAWSARIEQGPAKLHQHALEGVGKMPPRGNCKTCSDEEIADAVAYMLSKVQ